ncbi:adenylate/guanylate cyclase domain-containing protein [Adhaeribacter rhizoryzae]|uniref:Tetratricopeptide repeat protein n=1 Tax=Adhaeribacter rhizoryzae TaxID=2607907 RepID=A0A5M6D2D8_9BACT|nr:adenylate/guanylate cyclase domain-containing protein [Adhaeribacter rhizoryzae]KAA5541677.1 tetratricopeptide repeat protein [Adhaeribacter rhizoryzae]
MRQLAAIMFSDMVGYTALMQQNEQSAKEKRRRLKQVLETSVSGHNGKILQYYGDGALSIFNSAVDSVKCALLIQQTLRQEPKVDLRIGIHSGDISIEEETIYGDGVNLASRVESLAVPGSIFISEKVFDEIKNQETLSAREMGYFEFKNIIRPVRIFAIDNKGLVVPTRDVLRGKTKEPTNRLAVLPFVNLSADAENEYFSDGITEELLNALTKVNGLQVTSRTSAFAFKGKNTDIREIGIQLNVDKILEGSVRKAGNRVRITAQLINAADGYHIWSENYDRNLTDIFQVQDEISSIIANKLRENLTAKEHEETLVKVPTQNLEAYTLFLQGLHYHNKITPMDVKKAIACFEKAITLEPDYAQAYAMAAAGYTFLGATGQMQPKEAFALVHLYSDKALQLDNSLAMGYAAKGSAYLLYDWQWQQGYDALLKAIELNPATTGAHQMLSFYYMIIGQKQEAVTIMEKALQVDPLSLLVNKSLVDAYNHAGRTDEASKQVEWLLDLHPQLPVALELKGWCAGHKGDWQQAAEIFEEVHRLTKHPLKGLTSLGCAYGKLGETEKALACISKIERRQAEEPGVVLDADLAMIWWSLGEKDKAFYYLFLCVEKRMGPVAIIIEHPLFKVASDDPRYQLLKEQLNLVEYI